MKYFIACLFLWSTSLMAAPITAKSFIVANEYGEILKEKNADIVQPIASITKLMTAIVVLDLEQDPKEHLVIDHSLRKKYRTRLPRKVKTLPRETLLKLAIVKSDNLAAYTLCKNYSGGIENCVWAMNNKAEDLGLTHTHYTDPTGLDSGNVSNARDLVQLVIAAKEYQEIVDASGMINVKLDSNRKFYNTNPLVHTNNVIVSKTGYIRASGGCVVMSMVTDFGERIVVLLNSRTTRTRIKEAKLIANEVPNY